MKKVVLLSADARANNQLAQWLDEIPEEIEVETFTSIAALEAHYFAVKKQDDASTGGGAPQELPQTPPAAAAPPIASGAASAEEKEPENFIKVLIVDYDLLKTNLVPWLKLTRQRFQAAKLLSSTLPMNVMLIAYEGGKLQNYTLPEIDDLLYRPFDRALILQKIEMFLGERKAVSPSFLFKQKTDYMIDVGKEATVEELSEFAMAISNPVPLAVGVTARIYCEAFGASPDNQIIARVYNVKPHPTQRHFSICYFGYFGIRQSQLSHLRHYLREQAKKAGKKAKAKIEVAAPTPISAPLQVVLIDVSRESRDLIQSAVEANFSNIHLHVFPSYSSFLKMLIARAPTPVVPAPVPSLNAPAPTPASATPAKSAAEIEKQKIEELAKAAEAARLQEEKLRNRPTAFGALKELSMIVEYPEFGVASLEPQSKEQNLIFGVPTKTMLDRKTGWLDNTHAEDKEDFTEFLQYLAEGQPAATQVRINDPDHSPYYLGVKGSIERAGDGETGKMIRLQFKELSLEDWESTRKLSSGNSLGSIDAIIIDGALIRTEVPAWAEGLRELLAKANLLSGTGLPRILVTGDEKSRVQPGLFRDKIITDFIAKPFDRKLLSQKIALDLPGAHLKNKDIELSFSSVHVALKMAKEVKMEEVSEYGLQIQLSVPLRENVFIHFFSPLFLDEDGEGLVARCFHCVQDGSDAKVFHCFFTFFGVTDAFLKHIRTWIREDYVAQKDKG